MDVKSKHHNTVSNYNFEILQMFIDTHLYK